METKEIKLTDVCDFQGGTQPPKEEWIDKPKEGYVRMLQIRDFTQRKAEYIAYVKDHKKLNKCNSDDILIGRYGASVGKILTGLEGAYNVAIIKTIPDETKLLKQYLYYVLTGTSFQNFIGNIGARAAQAGFNKDDLTYFKFHLPSLENQKRIANILMQAEELIKQRSKSINLLDDLLKFTFIKYFGNVLTGEKLISLGTHLKLSGGGAFKSGDFEEEGIPVIKIGTVNKGYFDFDTLSFLPAMFKEKNQKYLVYPKDLLLSLTGTVGKDDYANTCFVPDNFQEYFLNQRVAKIIPDEKYLNFEFVSYLFKYPPFKKELIKANRGVRQANLSNDDVYKIKINFPTIELQKEFAKIVVKVDEMKLLYEIGKRGMENLFNSLGQKAFKGKLNIIEKNNDEINIVQPKNSSETVALEKINKELEVFHKGRPHSGAPDEIDNALRQLDAELQLRGEIRFWDEYVKYRIIKQKFSNGFTFDEFWQEFTKVPFDEPQAYDKIKGLIFSLLKSENPFLKQRFNESKKQIELFVNETASA